MAHNAPGCLPLASLKDEALRSWHAASGTFSSSIPSFTREQQLQKELVVDCRMQEADEAYGDMSVARPKTKQSALIAVRQRLQKSIVQFLHTFDCAVDEEMESRFPAVMDDFIRQAYAFDPAIGEDDVYQASRNVLIMNSFQMHLGKEVRLTPSVFAYSMLYPVTDNYLDAAHIGEAEKREANRRLRLRLMGAGLRAANPYERKIDALVKMIEAEFKRSAYPLVYESLLAIHSAQCRSVSQQGPMLPAGALLDVSVEKGGASVLADGYLVAGTLSQADEGFFFRFGVLLQLIDDLQDLQEDALRGHRTPALQAAAQGSLEEFTNRLFSFLSTVVARTNDATLHRLIEQSCRLLMLEAVAASPTFYPEGYLDVLEHHSPVRFAYLNGLKARLRDRRSAARDRASSYGIRRRVSRPAA